MSDQLFIPINYINKGHILINIFFISAFNTFENNQLYSFVHIIYHTNMWWFLLHHEILVDVFTMGGQCVQSGICVGDKSLFEALIENTTAMCRQF